MLLEKEGQKLGVDIVAAQETSPDFDFKKIALLKRSGIDFTYISYLDWHFAPESCLQMLQKRLLKQ